MLIIPIVTVETVNGVLLAQYDLMCLICRTGQCLKRFLMRETSPSPPCPHPRSSPPSLPSLPSPHPRSFPLSPHPNLSPSPSMVPVLPVGLAQAARRPAARGL